MRCLWITRQDPRPADSGELIHTLGLLDSLAATGTTEIVVLAHAAPRPAPRELPLRWELHGSIPQGRLPGMISQLPSDSWRLGNRIQRQALRGLLARDESWDWVVIDQAACGWALAEIPAGPRIAYIAHNHEATVRREVAAARGGSPLFRAALTWDAWKYGRLERAIGRRAQLIVAITPRDAAAFTVEHPQTPCVVLSPGYRGPIPAGDPAPITDSTPRRVVLAGTFEWVAKRRNLDTFLAAAAPLFPAAGITFSVVGKADPAWFAALAARHPWATFDANVPSIDPFLSGARMGVIPESLGGGFKLKALDYIFRGLPLAAVEPALSGLPLDPATDAVTAADPAALAAEIVRRIDDPPFLNAAAKRALDSCRNAFHWETRGRELARALSSPPR